MPQKHRLVCHKKTDLFRVLKEKVYLCQQNISNMKYLHRIADKVLKERLNAFGAILIEGPK